MRCLRQARSTEGEGSQKGSLGWALKVVCPISLGVEAGRAVHRSGGAQEAGEGQLAGTASEKGQRSAGKTFVGPNECPDSRQKGQRIPWVTGSCSRILNEGLISLASMQEGPPGQGFSSTLLITGPTH